MNRCETKVLLACLILAIPIGMVQAGPVPIGMGTTTISYETNNGPFSASGQRDYSGAGPTDATTLVGADNIRIFNSVNEFGRRPLVPGAIGPNESLISHAFFKTDNYGEFFPGLAQGGDIHVQFENIQFDQPVTVDESTILFRLRPRFVNWTGSFKSACSISFRSRR